MKIRSEKSQNGFFCAFLCGERVPDQGSLAVAGGNDRVAGGVPAGVDHGEASVLRDIAFGALGLDFLEFLFGVRFATAGVDGLNHHFIFVHMRAPFRRIAALLYSVPHGGEKLQMGRIYNV